MRSAAAVLLALATPALAAATPLVDPQFDAMSAAIKAKMLTDPAAAAKDAERARDYAERRPLGASRDLMVATAMWLAGEALSREGETERARPFVERAASAAARAAPGSRLHADALLLRGSTQADDGKVALAMADLHAAHELFRSLGDARGRARAFVQIANLYLTANDWTAALRYYREALDVYNADPGLAVAILNGEGVALLSSGQRAEALAAFRRSLPLAREMNSASLTATVLKNLAWALLEDGQARPATAAIKESIALAHQGAPPEFRRRQLVVLARADYQARDLPAAVALVDRAFSGVDLRRTELADRDSHQTAYDIYRALHRDGPALAHLTALKRLDDEATELARSNGVALMAARFDFANQELRIEKLKADDLRKTVAFERARAQTQQIVLIGVAAATLLIIAVLGFALFTARRSRNRVRAANLVLGSTNAALKKALAAKTEFLATTSHEIRTPLNGILGMTQVMLADPTVDATTRDRVTLVHGAGVTMRALVDDILDVAKMETGNLTIEARPFELSTALSDSARMWEEQARAKGLAFSVDVTECPATIVGDPGRVRQIVFNLLSNALKFTPSGSVSLRAAGQGERIVITVADTGIGIAPDRHEDIFESFRQADASTTREFGGTGLGLTICRNLARAMDGDVTVDSRGGEGATFTFAMPLVEAPAPAPAAASPPIETMVVDRNPIARAKLRALIEPVGGRVEAVADMDSAMALLIDARPSRIVVDDGALGSSAEAAAAAIRQVAAAAGAAVIIVLRREEGVARATLIEAGARIVLDRPVSRAALLAAVQRAPSDGTGWPVVTRAA